MTVSRRALLATPLLAGLLGPAVAAAAPIRIGVLRFGSVSWELDVMQQHRPDIAVEPVAFAAAQATQVALQAGRVDCVVQDWLWVSRQRASGADWTFAPTSSALGGVVVPAGSPLKSLADLAGKRLGIAGSPIDKSWLILRAYAQKTLGFDLDTRVEKSFGPPPLLDQQLMAGRLDAALTFWPFVAKAEAAGLHELLGMAEAIAGLGMEPGVPAVGFVFSERWAEANRPALTAFLAADAEARRVLATSDAEWDRIMPLTGAKSPGELARLRDGYRSGIVKHWTDADRKAAAALYDVLATLGGSALVGPATHLAPGTFWAGVPTGAE